MQTQIRTASKAKKVLTTVRENRNLKNKATVKTATKSDLIRSLIVKNKTAPEIRKTLEKRGFGVYPSEIYRLLNA